MLVPSRLDDLKRFYDLLDELAARKDGLSLGVSGQDHDAGGLLVESMYQAKQRRFIGAQLLGEYVHKLGIAASVGSYRDAGGLVYDYDVDALVYYFYLNFQGPVPYIGRIGD